MNPYNGFVFGNMSQNMNGFRFSNNFNNGGNFMQGPPQRFNQYTMGYNNPYNRFPMNMGMGNQQRYQNSRSAHQQSQMNNQNRPKKR